ncbi:MAG: S24/S26 family peptidase [Bacteroidales bacterium]
METRVIQNNLFFQEVASRIAGGERVRIRAKGNSMLPFIRDGKEQIILEKPDEESFQKGRLLLALLPERGYLLHRVKKIDEGNVLLQGDGNLSITETCTSKDVIAEATVVIRNGKEIIKESFRWNLYRYLWPQNYFLRRVSLGVYRRIIVMIS